MTTLTYLYFPKGSSLVGQLSYELSYTSVLRFEWKSLSTEYPNWNNYVSSYKRDVFTSKSIQAGMLRVNTPLPIILACFLIDFSLNYSTLKDSSLTMKYIPLYFSKYSILVSSVTMHSSLMSSTVWIPFIILLHGTYIMSMKWEIPTPEIPISRSSFCQSMHWNFWSSYRLSLSKSSWLSVSS